MKVIITMNLLNYMIIFIITKFIVKILLEKNHRFNNLLLLINQLNENFCNDREIVKIDVLQYASTKLRNDRLISMNS